MEYPIDADQLAAFTNFDLQDDWSAAVLQLLVSLMNSAYQQGHRDGRREARRMMYWGGRGNEQTANF